MNKHLSILFAAILFVTAQAHAETEDHSGHNMDHSGHDMSHDHEHDMSHHGDDDHKIDDPEDHSMHHADDHSDHSAHGHGHHHMDDSHIMDHEGGMIMGQIKDKLPSSCDSISEDIEITVHAGKKYAEKFPGTMFAFDKQEWRVKPCARITWHLVNDDHVRHQFMMHGLPRYMYNNGMFHLEVTGPRTISGTMIVPASDETYLVHCDISQHMEKGMKAQLVVGNGSEDLPSIPGLTPYAFPDTYPYEDLPQVSDKDDEDTIMEQITDFIDSTPVLSGMLIIGLLLGALIAPIVSRIISLRKKEEAPE
ncbi:MAG: copper oxidase [Nitrosomonas sp.]|nr:copper oxidase [Nitrosomonas sp.]